jgi:hypothetical protein
LGVRDLGYTLLKGFLPVECGLVLAFLVFRDSPGKSDEEACPEHFPGLLGREWMATLFEKEAVSKGPHTSHLVC